MADVQMLLLEIGRMHMEIEERKNREIQLRQLLEAYQKQEA